MHCHSESLLHLRFSARCLHTAKHQESNRLNVFDEVKTPCITGIAMGGGGHVDGVGLPAGAPASFSFCFVLFCFVLFCACVRTDYPVPTM